MSGLWNFVVEDGREVVLDPFSNKVLGVVTELAIGR